MLAVGDGYRFCLLRNAAPNALFRGGILFVHPFAEEMNKTRRAVALASRKLAENGWTVLQIDLEGCGDSSGDFATASWQGWQDDLFRAGDWLRQRGIPLRILWGLRLGALLASAVIDRVDPAADLLLWQPVLSGEWHLTQFLRLKAVEEMLGQSRQQGVTSRLRSELASGLAVDVAGYTVNSALASAIDGAELKLPDHYRGQIFWLESGRADRAELSPGSIQRIDTLIASGYTVTAHAVSGPSFWQTVEIEEAPALVDATISLLQPSQSEMKGAPA